jgi:PIN domain nuclease of toxin-antitoxin system
LRLLLDTHTLIWFYLDDPQLSALARLIIEDAANTKFVSPASYWELAIKASANTLSPRATRTSSSMRSLTTAFSSGPLSRGTRRFW